MIKKYKNFIEKNYKTGYFNYKNMPFNLYIYYKDMKTYINILYMDKYYTNLSIDIHGEELDKDEFFINPDLDKEIIKILEKEGFIECTNKIVTAGNKKTKSYKLI